MYPSGPFACLTVKQDFQMNWPFYFVQFSLHINSSYILIQSVW
jgi:hypothetical protein